MGSGVKDYTIYVSENNGPYSAWLSNTTTTSGTFTGQYGKTYAFYSVVQDQVGNMEDAKTSAEATTKLISNTSPIANAGANQTVTKGATVKLDETKSSDPDNGHSPLTYAWTQVSSGPAVSLTDANTNTASFVATQVDTYVFSLTVSDGAANNSASVTI